MKELTIEQKAKAYDKALERAKEFYILCKKCGAKDTVDFLEDNFPELCEPDDEKIRKTLLRWIQSNSYTNIAGMPIKNIIDWLEKQEGCEHIKKDWLEHIKQSWYKEGFIDGKYSGGASKEWTTNDAATLKELIDFLENGTAKLQHDLTRYANWLKIQFTPIEKQSEQKPSNKVEQKFKVGDWVVDNCGYVWKIEGILNQFYILEGVEGGESRPTIEWVNKAFHLWTIQDAKDGDVLIDKSGSRECPFIFKEIKPSDIKTDMLNPLAVLGYCGIGGAGFAKGSGWGDTANCIYYPATKEQRDILFKKMKDAGYEWDSEKKELKKVEQSKLTEFEDAVKDMMDDYRDAIDANDATTEEVKERAAYMLSLIPHKPADWSEEDESNLNGILDCYKSMDIKWRNWLKSIKQRIGG